MDKTIIFVSRNCIKFRLPEHSCLVTLIDSFHFFEVYIAANTEASDCQEVCPIIRSEVLAGIEAASEKLHYSNDHPELGVFCPSPECSSQIAASPASSSLRHAAVFKKDRCVCVKTSARTRLNDRQSIWLNPGRSKI